MVPLELFGHDLTAFGRLDVRDVSAYCDQCDIDKEEEEAVIDSSMCCTVCVIFCLLRLALSDSVLLRKMGL